MTVGTQCNLITAAGASGLYRNHSISAPPLKSSRVYDFVMLSTPACRYLIYVSIASVWLYVIVFKPSLAVDRMGTLMSLTWVP